MGFSRQEYWSGLPFPSPGDLPKPGIEPGSPALWADALSSEPPGKTLSPTNFSIHGLVYARDWQTVAMGQIKSIFFKMKVKNGFYISKWEKSK